MRIMEFIVNGSAADAGRYPYYASLRTRLYALTSNELPRTSNLLLAIMTS